MKVFILPSKDEKAIHVRVDATITKETYEKLQNKDLYKRVSNIRKEQDIECVSMYQEKNNGYNCQITMKFIPLNKDVNEVELIDLEQAAKIKATDFIKALCDLEVPQTKDDPEVIQRIQFCKEVVEGKSNFIDHDFFKELCACYVCIHEPDVT